MSSFPEKTWGTASGLSYRSLASRGSQCQVRAHTQACRPAARTWGSQQSVGEGLRNPRAAGLGARSPPSALPCFWALADAVLLCVWGSGVE